VSNCTTRCLFAKNVRPVQWVDQVGKWPGRPKWNVLSLPRMVEVRWSVKTVFPKIDLPGSRRNVLSLTANGRDRFSTLCNDNIKITDYTNYRGLIWNISAQIEIVNRQRWKQFVTLCDIGIYVKVALSKKSGCTGYANFNGLKREIGYWPGKLSKNAHCPSEQSYKVVPIFLRHLLKIAICSKTLHPAASKQNWWICRKSLCDNDLHRIFRKFAPRVRKCV